MTRRTIDTLTNDELAAIIEYAAYADPTNSSGDYVQEAAERLRRYADEAHT